MNKRGVALIYAFLIIAVLAILGGAIVLRSVSERSAAESYSKSTKSFWLAEAGIEGAVRQLKQNWYNRTTASMVSLSKGEGTYSFDIYDTDDFGNDLPERTLRIVSTGDVDGTIRTLEVVIKRFVEMWDYAIYGVNMVELKAGTTVHGDVYVDGDAEVKAGASIVKINDSVVPADPDFYNADLYYTGTTADVYGTVEGGVIPSTDSIPIPTIDWIELKNNADFVVNNGTTLTGNLSGVYYAKGKVTLVNANLNGAIVAEGDIEINGDFTQTNAPDGVPCIGNQTGTIEVDGTATANGLVYCGELGIELKTGTTMTVYGSVVGANSDVELKTSLGSLDVYHKEEYLEGFPLSSSIKTLSWKELMNPYPLTP